MVRREGDCVADPKLGEGFAEKVPHIDEVRSGGDRGGRPGGGPGRGEAEGSRVVMNGHCSSLGVLARLQLN